MDFSMLKLFIQQIKEHRASWSELKYYLRWKKSLRPETSSVKDKQPWITFAAIDILDNYLNSSSRVFEYGGGGSTLFFADRVKEVVTAEHDREWFNVLADIIKSEGLTNWKGLFIEPEKGDLFPVADKANPGHYSSEDEKFKGLNFKAYAFAIDSFPDEYFDVVLVDGRSRPSCMKHGIPKLKKGGFLVLDNSDRTYYTTFFSKVLSDNFTNLLHSSGACPYLTWFTQTSIWKKK